jgi:broad specificity phosphatase PhoE
VATIYLIRHAQASFGALDYDVLTAFGERQAAHLGRVLRRRGITPSLVVSGGLRRQRDTARLAVEAASYDVAVRIDRGYDEWPVESLLTTPEQAARVAALAHEPEAVRSRLLQQVIEEATRGWCAAGTGAASGERRVGDGGCGGGETVQPESYDELRSRVMSALDRTAAQVTSGETAMVVTSGAVLDMIVTTLLEAPPWTWLRLQPIWVNTGITTVSAGSTGLRVLTVNEHAHLDGDDGQLFSYR